jgi:hypothetical protein
MGLKFLNASGSGTIADAINAIDFALQAKMAFSPGSGANVRVLSNSWGGGSASDALLSEIEKARAAEMLFVAAAGNASSNNDGAPFYPASFSSPTNNVVAVAATDSTDHLSSFSNYGASSVDVAAPGTAILSTVRGGYASFSGTSMATPHVSGAAALILSSCSLTVSQLKSVIRDSVDVLPSLTGLVSSNGRVNVDRAIRGCANVPPSISLTGPSDHATFTAPAQVTLTATATDTDGIRQVDFFANGAPLGTVTTSPYTLLWPNVGAGSYVLTAVATDSLGATASSGPVTITVNPVAGRSNVALASGDALAIGSSTYASGYAPTGAINGDRRGMNWGAGGGWNDATPDAFPDWLEVDFNGPQTIDEVDVFSVQDNYQAPSDPTPAMTFTRYGLTDFQVQYWTGAQWVAVPGGAIAGNNLVWRRVTFPPLTTAKIRIWVTAALTTWSRITEVEAYSSGAP